MWLDILMFLGGGLAVWVGAEGMVRGSVKLAAYWGVPSLIIGLTVVAFGTSAPELVVSVVAAVDGASQIALGNVLGSNIINVGLVLGLSVVISPIVVSPVVLKRDVPFAVGVTLVVVLMAWLGGEVSRIDGIVLLACFVLYFWISYRAGTKEQARMTAKPGWKRPKLKPRDITFLVGGGVVLALGAKGMVDGAVGIAQTIGISQMVIGTTIVAMGTSLPELAASAVAARKGEGDLALGNVIGSNLYNILLILGTTTVIQPIQSEVTWLSFDYIFFVALILVLVPMLRIGWKLSRTDGIILLAMYAAFNILLVVF